MDGEDGAGAPIRLDLQILAERKLFSLRSWRRACRRVGSRCAEARRNRLPRCLRGTLVLRTSRNDHNVALAANLLFGTEAKTSSCP